MCTLSICLSHNRYILHVRTDFYGKTLASGLVPILKHRKSARFKDSVLQYYHQIVVHSKILEAQFLPPLYAPKLLPI